MAKANNYLAEREKGDCGQIRIFGFDAKVIEMEIKESRSTERSPQRQLLKAHDQIQMSLKRICLFHIRHPDQK